MQFENKITSNVIAKDEVLKQSQNQTQNRLHNVNKRLLHSVRNDEIVLFQQSLRDNNSLTPLDTKIILFIILYDYLTI